MQRFIAELRVRHYEMDALGHVNNAVYQHYLEQAAFEHSEHLGFTLERYRELGGVWVLRKMEIEYLRPAVAGDRLEVATWVHTIRGPRSTRRYEIRRKHDQALLVTAEALWVWVEVATMRPRAIPQVLLDGFTATIPDEV